MSLESVGSEPGQSPMARATRGERKLKDIRLLLRLFPRCILRQFQKEQPFVRDVCPQGELRRPVAGLDHTRVLHICDAPVVLCPFHGVAGQIRVLLHDMDGSEAFFALIHLSETQTVMVLGNHSWGERVGEHTRG